MATNGTTYGALFAPSYSKPVLKVLNAIRPIISPKKILLLKCNVFDKNVTSDDLSLEASSNDSQTVSIHQSELELNRQKGIKTLAYQIKESNKKEYYKTSPIIIHCEYVERFLDKLQRNSKLNHIVPRPHKSGGFEFHHKQNRIKMSPDGTVLLGLDREQACKNANELTSSFPIHEFNFNTFKKKSVDKIIVYKTFHPSCDLDMDSMIDWQLELLYWFQNTIKDI